MFLFAVLTHRGGDSPLTGGGLFQHRLSGVRELRKRVRP